MRDGRTVRGVAKNFNNYSVQIADAQGRLHLLERADLAKFDVSDTSLMPPVDDASLPQMFGVFGAAGDTPV